MTAVETVAVLFTDLVGSTGLASRIGPAAAEELGREHLDVLRVAIEGSGGTEVKSLGDGLMVVFPSAVGAAACAVSMQQQIEHRNRLADEQLGLRVGLSVGDASVEDGDYFGTPVVEAARLCARASAGEILIKELVRQMAGGRGDYSYTSVGELELKGIPEPVATVRLDWEPSEDAAANGVPVPPRLRESPPIGYVGRAAERERLARVLAEAREGRRRLVLLSGEPGIGKTRLAAHTAFEAHSAGATVLYGRCEEDLGVPYAPWVEALRHFVAHAPGNLLRDHVARHGGEIARIAPVLITRIEDVPGPRETDPDTERYLLWDAVAALLVDASRAEPVVLIVDDLHWADRPTLSLLKHVIGHDAEARLVVIATYRDSDVGREHPLADVLADLRREQGVDRIGLAGLEQPDIVAIMESAGGHGLDDRGMQFAHEILRETDGNPFYVAELLRHLWESGSIFQEDDGSWSLRGTLEELGLPQSVREVVGRRVERLGGEVTKALSVAAVIGRDFDVELLLHLTDRSEDELLDLLEAAVAASVLSESTEVAGRFSFAHALINHTLYDGLGTTRRTRLHGRVAEALETICGDDPGGRLGELAHHWAKATAPVHAGKAVEYARRAGERALDQLAPDEALRWFTQALELQGQHPELDRAERCDLLIGLGEAQRQVGEAAYRETLLEASRLGVELGDADRASRAALANTRGEVGRFGEVDLEQVAALEQAVELGGLANPGRRARLLALHALELQFDIEHEPRRALAEEALALAREAGDPRTLGWVLCHYFQAHWSTDTLSALQAITRELVDVAATARDPVLEARAQDFDAMCRIGMGDIEGGRAGHQRFRGLARASRQPALIWFAAFRTAAIAFIDGHLAESERLALAAAEYGAGVGQADAWMVYGAQFSLARTYAGKPEVDLVLQAAKENPGLPAWRAGAANVCAWAGRLDEAAEVIHTAAAEGFQLPYDQIRATGLALYADAVAHVRDPDAAGALYALIDECQDRVAWSGGSVYGHWDTYLGLLASVLGEDSLADRHFAASCDFHERNGMDIFEARARLGWAEALARRGVSERAREEAGRALALSRSGGYGAFESRAGSIVDSGVAVR